MGAHEMMNTFYAKNHTDGSLATMGYAFDFVMTEHAAWRRSDCGSRRVFVLDDGGRWFAKLQDGKLTLDRLSGTGAEPMGDIFAMSEECNGIPELATALQSLGPVFRFRNSDLWDAIGTSIIRQVIRAGQSKKMYSTFCQTYGEQVDLPDGNVYALFPAPEIVLELSDEQFSSIGMAFKRRPLRAAAQAYMERRSEWCSLSPEALMAELQTVPRIGPWTAQATVADWSNDWSLYPYADLAVRTWAKRAAPSHEWPDDELKFGQAWRTLAGQHLGSLTLLTLAWGSQHGDIG